MATRTFHGEYRYKTRVQRKVLSRVIGLLQNFIAMVDDYNDPYKTSIIFIDDSLHSNESWSNGTFYFKVNDVRKIDFLKRILEKHFKQFAFKESNQTRSSPLIANRDHRREIVLTIKTVHVGTELVILECTDGTVDKIAYLHRGVAGFYEMISVAKPGMTITVQGDEYTGFDDKLSILIKEYWYFM